MGLRTGIVLVLLYIFGSTNFSTSAYADSEDFVAEVSRNSFVVCPKGRTVYRFVPNLTLRRVRTQGNRLSSRVTRICGRKSAEEVLQEPPLPTGSEGIECNVLDMSGDRVVGHMDLSRLVRQRKSFDLNGDNKLSSIDTKILANCWGELGGGSYSDQPTTVPTVTPSPTPIASPSPPPSPTATPTSTPTPSPSPTASATPTPNPTSTPTSSPTPTVTPTPTSTPTPVTTATPTPTPSGTPTTNATYAGVVINASRLTGTAPASFYFDVVDQLSWSAIEEARFDWDFGDGSPMFRGYMAAHVYDQPGTYEVTLRVYYQGNFVREARRTVQVTPFSGTTCYVSSSTGANTNSGLSPSAPFATYQYAMQQCLQSNRRILFRRGDTFTIQGGVSVSGIQNFILGAYGAGAPPHFNWPHTGLWDSAISGSFTNSSFQDFSITGNFVPNVSAGASVFQLFGQHNTVQRITASNLWRFVYTDASTDALVFKDLDLRTLDAYGHYGSNSERLAFLDSAMEYSHYEHLIRIQGGHKVLVNNTDFNLVRNGKTTLTFRGDFNYGLVSDSRFDRTTTVGPENDESYQLQDFVIYERNDFYEGTASLGISAEHVVVRNNLFSRGGHISLRTHPLVGAPNIVRIYNNTFYAPGQYHTSVLLSGATNVIMVNNIMSGATSIFESHAYSIGNAFNPSLSQIDFNTIYQPNRTTATSFFLYYLNSIMSLSTWQNTYGKELFIQTVDPQFVDPDNGNFALSTTSPSRNAAVPMEFLPGAFEDYYGTLRSRSETNRGAVQ